MGPHGSGTDSWFISIPDEGSTSELDWTFLQSLSYCLELSDAYRSVCRVSMFRIGVSFRFFSTAKARVAPGSKADSSVKRQPTLQFERLFLNKVWISHPEDSWVMGFFHFCFFILSDCCWFWWFCRPRGPQRHGPVRWSGLWMLAWFAPGCNLHGVAQDRRWGPRDWPVCMNYEYLANSKTRFVIDLKTCWAVACQVFARRPTAPSECCRIQGVVGCRGKASSARGCLSVPCQGSSWESYPPRLAYKQQATQGALETSARLQSTRISGLHMFALSEVREMWYCGTHAWSTRVVHQLQPEHPELWHPVGSVTVDATGAWCHTCVAWLDPIRPDLCHLTKSNCP